MSEFKIGKLFFLAIPLRNKFLLYCIIQFFNKILIYVRENWEISQNLLKKDFDNDQILKF